MGLRQQLAEHGFESNDDYEFQIRSLLNAGIDHLRCLQICGDSGRRKTALASALAQALAFPRMLYFDFTQPEPPPEPATISAEEDAISSNEPAIGLFERCVLEACAFSEAERCILILDQLQAALFHDQIKLFEWVRTGQWQAASGTVRAHSPNLLVVLISEQPIYHSLAHLSYRIWADASSGRFDYRPDEFGLDHSASNLFMALAELFLSLSTTPTHSELRHIIDDALHHVRTSEQLRHCIFGWMERIDREQLNAPSMSAALQQVVDEVCELVGVDEIELNDAPLNANL